MFDYIVSGIVSVLLLVLMGYYLVTTDRATRAAQS